MKRKIIVLAGVVAALATAYVGNHLRAAQDPQVQQVSNNIPQAPPRTRIAVINMVQVVKNYDKWKTFEDSFKQTYSHFTTELETRRARMVQMKADLAKLPPDDPKAETIKAEMRNLDRASQDYGEDAKKQLKKMEEEAAVGIYREISEAVEHYARSNDIELVVNYNDAITPQDFLSPANVQRKMGMNVCTPIYMTPGMNITDAVTAMLNQRLRAMQPQTQPAPQR